MLIRIHRRQDRLLGTSYQTEHAEHIEHMSMLCAALQNPQINPTLGHFDYIEHRTDPTLARDHVEHCSNISNIARTFRTLIEYFEHFEH